MGVLRSVCFLDWTKHSEIGIAYASLLLCLQSSSIVKGGEKAYGCRKGVM